MVHDESAQRRIEQVAHLVGVQEERCVLPQIHPTTHRQLHQFPNRLNCKSPLQILIRFGGFPFLRFRLFESSLGGFAAGVVINKTQLIFYATSSAINRAFSRSPSLVSADISDWMDATSGKHLQSTYAEIFARINHRGITRWWSLNKEARAAIKHPIGAMSTVESDWLAANYWHKRFLLFLDIDLSCRVRREALWSIYGFTWCCFSFWISWSASNAARYEYMRIVKVVLQLYHLLVSQRRFNASFPWARAEWFLHISLLSVIALIVIHLKMRINNASWSAKAWSACDWSSSWNSWMFTNEGAAKLFTILGRFAADPSSFCAARCFRVNSSWRKVGLKRGNLSFYLFFLYRWDARHCIVNNSGHFMMVHVEINQMSYHRKHRLRRERIELTDSKRLETIKWHSNASIIQIYLHR